MARLGSRPGPPGAVEGFYIFTVQCLIERIINMTNGILIFARTFRLVRLLLFPLSV